MKICVNCGKEFEVTDSDRSYYEMMEVPEPVNCPRCRLIRRLAERNAKNLFYRKCDFSGKMLISQYDENVPFPVYDKSVWWGDEWNPESYGRDYDFERPFFEQFYELWIQVPRMSLFISGDTLENSDYVNCAGYLKNCYLIGEADFDEDCYYSNRVFHSKNIVDCSTVYENEICYEVIDCLNCQRLFYSQDCKSCHDSYFLNSCNSCQDCIGCINQRQKQYMIFNKQYTKVEYEQHKAAFALDTLKGVQRLRQQCNDFFTTQIHRSVFEEQNQNCLGDHLFNSKNSFNCFDCKDLEDCKYCVRLFDGVKNCMDHTSWGHKAELIYHCVAVGDNVYNIKFCSNSFMNCSNLEYCQHVVGSQDCFGSIGLKRKKFVILNKQYSEAEYHELKAKIIAHMKSTGDYGLFFPKNFASHGYNATLAMDEFPKTKDEALAAGYQWTDTDEIQSQKAIGNILVCNTCNRNYKFIAQELDFYEKYKVPRPEHCALCRHKARQAARNPIELLNGNCDNCKVEIKTTLPLNRRETVYCNACYLAEIY